MRRGNLIILLVALAMGSVAALMARSWIERHTTVEKPVLTVVVANAQLPFGTPLTDDNVSEIPWTGEALPEGAFAKKLDLLKDGRRVALTAIEKSEVILRPKITAPGQRASLSSLLEEGKRAVTVRVDDVRGVAGFILPGDRVDVMVLKSETRQGESENSADVLLEFVKVLAIDQLMGERIEATVATVAKAVTLEVTPEQAQKVVLASNIGKLSLVLRQPGEGRSTQARRITDEDLGPAFARRQPVKAEPAPAPAAVAPAPPRVVNDVANVTIFHGTDAKKYDVVRE